MKASDDAPPHSPTRRDLHPEALDVRRKHVERDICDLDRSVTPVPDVPSDLELLPRHGRDEHGVVSVQANGCIAGLFRPVVGQRADPDGVVQQDTLTERQPARQYRGQGDGHTDPLPARPGIAPAVPVPPAARGLLRERSLDLSPCGPHGPGAYRVMRRQGTVSSGRRWKRARCRPTRAVRPRPRPGGPDRSTAP